MRLLFKTSEGGNRKAPFASWTLAVNDNKTELAHKKKKTRKLSNKNKIKIKPVHLHGRGGQPVY